MDDIKIEKPIHEFEKSDPTNPLPSVTQLTDIYGMFDVVTVFPTLSPSQVGNQIKLWVDSLTSPTRFFLCVFIPKVNVWKAIALGVGPSPSPSASPSKSPSLSPSISPSVSPS